MKVTPLRCEIQDPDDIAPVNNDIMKNSATLTSAKKSASPVVKVSKTISTAMEKQSSQHIEK
eukprot:12286420-Ditylum_brightwellii.AAC.2